MGHSIKMLQLEILKAQRDYTYMFDGTAKQHQRTGTQNNTVLESVLYC